MNSKIVLSARLLLGLMFTIFGLNGLLMNITGSGFIPMPPPPPEMMAIMTGFMATKYLMVLVSGLQFISGLLLLSNLFLNLAIVFLGPIIVNIVLIHVFVEHSGLPMAIIVSVLFAILMKSKWEVFKPFLNKK